MNDNSDKPESNVDELADNAEAALTTIIHMQTREFVQAVKPEITPGRASSIIMAALVKNLAMVIAARAVSSRLDRDSQQRVDIGMVMEQLGSMTKLALEEILNAKKAGPLATMETKGSA